MRQRWQAGGAPAAGATIGRRDAALPRTARAVAAGAALLSAVGAGVVGLALLVARQEQLVWQPPRFGRPDPAAPPEGAGRLDYAAADGQRLFAWTVEPPDGRAVGTLLYFHGNAELAAWSVPWAREVARRTGWRVLLPEYRGYAGLGGAPSHAGSRRDAAAAWAVLRGLSGAAGPVALYGHSLGSAIATELAGALAEAGTPPAALLLESPFTSVRAMARLDGSPALDGVWARIARVTFDTRARVAALDVPVSVAHGLVDLVIPARMGMAVHDAARVRGPLLLVPRAGHNSVSARGGADYWAWLRDALDASPAAPSATAR
ncbi:MAG: alpha/beta hydrolase [Gemmatirosa sp.]